jgi:heat shock protein HtpX
LRLKNSTYYHLSKTVAKYSTGARVIKNSQNQDESWFLDVVARHANRANIGMPEVAIYDGESNTFAAGCLKTTHWWRYQQVFCKA